jgi:hypothetical protein
MSKKEAPPAAADAPATALASLAQRARERLGPEPDRAGPAATKTLAAIVRDLKGMPEILVTRDGTHRIKLARRGKVGSLTLDYDQKVRFMQLELLGFPGSEDPTTARMFRYTLHHETGEWRRLDDAGEIIEDVRRALLRLYPEIEG